MPWTRGRKRLRRGGPFGYHRRVGLADSSEAVLAGSPAFLNSVLPPLSAALGVRPRVADAPHQVFALCQDGARLAVFEYRGQEWLPLAEDLKNAFGDELRVVVAVPAQHAAASGPLMGTGADEVLPWDGTPDGLVAAAALLAGPPAGAAGPAPGAAPAEPVTPAHPMPALTPAWPTEAFAAAAPEPPEAAAAPPVPPVAEDEPAFAIVEAPPDAQARWGDAELVAFERSGTWPGTVIASRDAEGLLAGALAGFWPEAGDLRAQAERMVAVLSPLERNAITGRPVPADPAPVCRAAALRWQVSAALRTAPAPGSPVDSAAVRAILAEIDAVLAELKRVSPGAPAGALPSLDRLRRELVSEAVDLTEAVHRIARPADSWFQKPGARPGQGARAAGEASLQPPPRAASRPPR